MHDRDCEECPLAQTRRDFLRDSAGIALAVFATLGFAAPAGSAEVTYPLPGEDGAHIDRDNQVILVRWQNRVFAFALSCPHQRTALRWMPNDARFQCPKHKSRYEPDGTFISGRATRGMDRYALRRDGASIIVDTQKLYKEDVDADKWQAAWLVIGEK